MPLIQVKLIAGVFGAAALRLIARAVRHPVGFPEPPRPDFRDRSREFVDALIPLLR
jgi:hypothetical protein